MIRRPLRALLALAVPSILVVGACTEHLDTAAACPLLCPGQELDVIDTVIDPAFVLDTTVGTFPFIGAEAPLVLAKRGDTLDLRAIFRFDTMPRVWVPTGDTSQSILEVDSASLQIQLRNGNTPLPANFTIEAYDVGDTTLVDSLPGQLLPLFTAANLLGSLALDSATFEDTSVVDIPLDSAKVRAIIGTEGSVLRIGLLVTSVDPVTLMVTTYTQSLTEQPTIRFKPSTADGTSAISFVGSSRTPVLPPGLSTDFVDYQLVAVAPDLLAPDRFLAGALPAYRSYLKFDLPIWLTDSVYVLRAQLELTQDPTYGLDEGDTLTVFAHMSLGGHALTDLRRAANILADAGVFITDEIERMPSDSGLVKLEVGGAVRQWRTVDGVAPFPTAIVLRSASEATSAQGLRFFGINAAPPLRPRLRVSYVPNITFGRP